MISLFCGACQVLCKKFLLKQSGLFTAFKKMKQARLKIIPTSCYNRSMSGPGGHLTTARLILAIVSTSVEEVAIVAIWRWLLPEFGIELSLSVLIGVMAAWAAFSVSLFVFTTRTLKRQIVVGLPTMIGSKGKVASPLAPEGLVRIKGELWGATSGEGNVGTGEEIEVVEEDGLKLVVRRIGTNKSIR